MWPSQSDPVRVGAASSTSAGTGAETGAGLTGAGASGWARRNRSGSRRSRVLERRLRLVLRRSWTETARGKRRE